MTYARPVNPIFFTDITNCLKINGGAKTDILTDRAGVYNSGSDKFDLFDLNPQNVCSFATSGNTTTHIVIEIDLGDSGASVDYCAILNHNLVTAEAEVRIAHRGVPIEVAGQGTEVASTVNILNSTTGVDHIAGLADGDTMFSFTSSSDRYWSIEITDQTGFSATDLFMGAVMLGEKYSIPLSPDMNINHSFSFDGVNISTGLSGKRHSNPSWIKANNTTEAAGNYIPFRLDVGAQQLPGRESYSLSYPVIQDTDLLPSDLGAPSGDSFAVNVMSKTGWNALPFIMGVDSTSTTQGDYIFCRFRDNSYSLTQIASKVHSTSFSVDQEF